MESLLLADARRYLLLSQEEVITPNQTKRHLQGSEGFLISVKRNSEGNS